MPYYKGHKIVLCTGVQHDGRWIYDYGMSELAKGARGKSKGTTHGTYPTREEAQAAGLKQAQHLIDSRASST